MPVSASEAQPVGIERALTRTPSSSRLTYVFHVPHDRQCLLGETPTCSGHHGRPATSDRGKERIERQTDARQHRVDGWKLMGMVLLTRELIDAAAPKVWHRLSYAGFTLTPTPETLRSHIST